MDVLLTPDEVLLRRFGYVRAVGGGAYIAAVAVLFVLYGLQVWPLLLGVPVLAVVTTWYFRKFGAVPRTVVTVSLLADTIVLGGAVAYVGGTGSGLVMVYAIVIVSSGILLGPAAARAFTALCLTLGLLQLGLEQAGSPPALLHRPELGDRVPVLLIGLGVLASVGFLTATYASRLHELIALAGMEAEAVRSRGRRRRELLRHVARDAEAPLRELEAVAEALERPEPGADERRKLAARLRVGVSRVAGEVAKLADVGAMDETADHRPEPVSLAGVVRDVVVALGDRLERYEVDLDLPDTRAVAYRRAANRVVYNLLENVVDHTPQGTTVRVTLRTSGSSVVLAVADDGPGVPVERRGHLFDARRAGADPTVGLPLVAELCRDMRARVRYEPAPSGGSRFFVVFRLAPAAPPGRAEDADRGGEAAG